MRRRLALVGVVLGVAPVGCAASTGGPAAGPGPSLGDPPIPTSAQRATVASIVDGDTFWVRVAGASGRTKVRLLEYDTPERGECWFAQATAALAELTPVGSTVWLAADRDPQDRYGRALRYVWTERGVFVDLAMVRAGMGHALLVRPNDAHIRELRAGELEARRAGRGLWSGC